MTCKWPSFCRWIVLDELWNMLRKKSVAIVTVTRSYQRHPGGLELAGSPSNYRVVLSDWTTRKWPRKQKKYLGTPCKIIKSVNFFMANLKSYLPLKKNIFSFAVLGMFSIAMHFFSTQNYPTQLIFTERICGYAKMFGKLVASSHKKDTWDHPPLF